VFSHLLQGDVCGQKPRIGFGFKVGLLYFPKVRLPFRSLKRKTYSFLPDWSLTNPIVFSNFAFQPQDPQCGACVWYSAAPTKLCSECSSIPSAACIFYLFPLTQKSHVVRANPFGWVSHTLSRLLFHIFFSSRVVPPEPLPFKDWLRSPATFRRVNQTGVHSSPENKISSFSALHGFFLFSTFSNEKSSITARPTLVSRFRAHLRFLSDASQSPSHEF